MTPDRRARSHLSSSESPTHPRLGFAVKILGADGLRSHDSRRWENKPHLRVSLTYLRAILSYLKQAGIGMYRMASALAPYATHPDHPQFHGQVEQCLDLLADVGALARRRGIRLSFHPGQFIVLNTPDEDLAQRSIADIEIQARILDAMGLGDEAVVVTHVGGAYGDRKAALDRFARRLEGLTPVARGRLVVENDDGRFGVKDVLKLHRTTGIRVVFDVHHHRCFDPDGIPLADAARACIATWQGGPARPKVHFSSPRTDWGIRDGNPAPRNWKAHAEFADPFSFIGFYRQVADLEPDVMLEAKAKDLAVLQLQKDLRRFAPDLTERFHIKDSRGVSEARVA